MEVDSRNTPPSLDPHSKVKHQLVTDYLRRYIAVLMANERMPSLKLTLVDGFAGGGLYTDGANLALGSPLAAANGERSRSPVKH
jgi:three-Cys-motif partner protein